MNRFSEILNEYKFKTELHAHTLPVSKCSHISPEEMAENYASIGCNGVVITNHLNPEWLESDPLSRAEEYLDDYYRAKSRGDQLGLNVIFGVEIRFTENSNDYLVYGIEPSDVVKMIPYLDKGLETFYREFKNEKNLILQAHPFRNNMVLAPLNSIDGIETFNCHPKHNSRVGVAARYARDNNLIACAGTDYHDPGDHGICVMRSKSLPVNSYDIANILKNRDYLFDISGNIVFPYGD